MAILIGESSVKIELPSASKEEGKTEKVDPLAQATPQNTTPSVAINNQSTPIWFILKSFNHRKDTHLQLPQLPNRYIRVENRDMTVAYVQKYVAMKLGLESENEVELYLRDLPLDPSMWLLDLLNYWVATTCPQTILTRTGASAEDYMLIISYGRKA
ncbi:unnamed protein product [Microthlaspi erraticum]|uniref:Uncharacterized protein n=1 Tax=Microthlaspi erraticum TaxID=1685480 RepID=A0A6D2IT47_9BRAS|nr:unnamed protein product [Microthlaspi erraticum]